MTTESARPRPGTDPLPAGSSVWLVAQRTLTMQRRGRFVPESGQHPGRMAPDLAAEAIRRYTRPGDVVLDPMCGIGTTLIEAVHAGRHAVGVECEPRWAGIARANLDLAARQGATGQGTVITGDARQLRDLTVAGGSRDLAEVARRVRLLLTSPPYGASTHGRVEVPPGDGPLVSHLHERYTPALPGRASPRDPVNLAHTSPAGLMAGLTEIFTACVPLLAPGAVVVVTARPWRQDGLLVDLPGLVATAAENAGLRLAGRCVALLAGQRDGRLIPRHSFHQLLQARWARQRGDRRLLTAHEDIMVLLPPELGLAEPDWQGPVV